MYYTQGQIDRANQADLVSFLQSQGEQHTRAGQEYRWKRHDSLTVRGNKWYRHSQSKGGGPVDFVMEFFGKSFTEAVELLTGEKGAAPPLDRPSPAPLSDFRLPPRSTDNRIARNYLTAAPALAEYRISERYKVFGRWSYDNRLSMLTNQTYGLWTRMGNSWIIEYIVTERCGSTRQNNFSFGARVTMMIF